MKKIFQIILRAYLHEYRPLMAQTLFAKKGPTLDEETSLTSAISIVSIIDEVFFDYQPTGEL